jgi:hypothetical protein
VIREGRKGGLAAVFDQETSVMVISETAAKTEPVARAAFARSYLVFSCARFPGFLLALDLRSFF